MSEKIAMRRSRFTDGLQVLVEHFDDGTRLVFVSFTDGDLAEAAPGVVMFGEEFDQLVEFVNAPFDRVRDAVPA